MANQQLFQLGARTLALTDLVPTQDAAGSASLGKNTWQQAKDLLTPKVYTGTLSQFGTNAPTVSVASNTLGSATLARSDVGEYSLTITGAFTLGKTVVVTLNQSIGSLDVQLATYQTDVNRIDMVARTISGGVPRELNLGDSFSILIFVYP
jgi:hypothetical protein